MAYRLGQARCPSSGGESHSPRFHDAKVMFISDLCNFFEEKKCILIADLLKKKSFSSRITYNVKNVNVYTWYNVGKKN